MNTIPHISIIGAILAIIFTVSMASLITWMLRVPPQIPHTIARVRRTFDAIKSIMVPITGTFYSTRAIELACRMASNQKAEIILTYVLEIPMISPLDVAIPHAEKKALEILEEGKKLVELHELPCRTLIQRARTAGPGIVQAAQDEEVDMIVIGIKPKSQGDVQDIIGRTANWLIRKAPCEIIIDKLPEGVN